PDRSRERIQDQLLLRETGRHYADKLSLRISHASTANGASRATTRQRTVDLRTEMAAHPDRTADPAAQGDQQPPKELVRSELIGSEQEVLMQTPLFAVEPGTVVVMQPNPQNGALWMVALVEERSESGASSGRNYPEGALSQIGLQMLRP